MKKLFQKFADTLGKRVSQSSNAMLGGSHGSEFAKRTAAKIAARETAALSKDAEKNKHKRKEKRTAITAVAELAFPDRGFSLEGVIVEASRGGLTFRPASHYIEERVGEQIQVRVNDSAKNGVIRATRVTGYGIQLFDAFEDVELARLRDTSVDLRPFNAAAA